MEPTSIPFDEVRIHQQVFLPGRNEFARVMEIINAGRHRIKIKVLLESGAAVSYPRAGWSALDKPKSKPDTLKAKAIAPRSIVPPPRITVVKRGNELPNPVREQEMQRAANRKDRKRRYKRPPRPVVQLPEQPLPEIPGPPVPLPKRNKPKAGLWSDG